MRHLPLNPEIFIQNRERFMAEMKPASIAIFNSNDEVPVNADSIYKFQQNSDLYWLTGIMQEDTMLILNPDNPEPKFREVLVVVRPNPEMEKWVGRRLTEKDAKSVSGIKTVVWLDTLDARLMAWIHASENIYLNTIEHDRKPNHLYTRDYRYIQELKEKYPLHQYLRSQPILKKLRAIKSAEEVEVIQKAVDITHKAFLRVMKFIKPGVFEYEIEAEIIHEFLRNGSKGEAYGTIIAGGDNARVLHYVENGMPVKDGDLVLMDFGALYGGYAADMTRTIPVNGKFTDRQKVIYNACLHLHNYAKSLLKPGITIKEYHDLVADEATRMFIEIGLLTKEDTAKDKREDMMGRAYRKYLYHGISHFLGLDVHDVGSFTDPIKPGMVFTVEPGIYIESEKIGIRIENNVVITEDGNRDLFEGIPITIEEIEAAMSKD